MRGLSLRRRHKRSCRCKMVQRRWRISTAFAVLVEERGDCEGNIVEPWDHARCHHLILGHRRDVRLPLQRRVYLWSLLPGDFYIFHRLIWALGVLVLDYRFRSLPASLLLDGKYTNVYSVRLILLRIIRTTLKVDKCRWIFVVLQVSIVFSLVRCALSRCLVNIPVHFYKADVKIFSFSWKTIFPRVYHIPRKAMEYRSIFNFCSTHFIF